jgi:hypothetical protein
MSPRSGVGVSTAASGLPEIRRRRGTGIPLGFDEFLLTPC